MLEEFRVESPELLVKYSSSRPVSASGIIQSERMMATWQRENG